MLPAIFAPGEIVAARLVQSTATTSNRTISAQSGRLAMNRLFGVHPLGCPKRKDTLKRGHRTALCRFMAPMCVQSWRSRLPMNLDLRCFFLAVAGAKPPARALVQANLRGCVPSRQRPDNLFLASGFSAVHAVTPTPKGGF